MEHPEIIPIAVFGAVAVFVIYRLLRYRGVVGLVYGKRHRSLGEVQLPKGFAGTAKVILHELESDTLGGAGDLVLELRSRTGASFQSMPYRIPRDKARELAALLNKAGNA